MIKVRKFLRDNFFILGLIIILIHLIFSTLKPKIKLNENRITFSSIKSIRTNCQCWGGFTIFKNTLITPCFEGGIYLFDLKKFEKKNKICDKFRIWGKVTSERGFLFFSTMDGEVISYDLNRNKIKWKFNSKCEIWSSPIIFDNMIFFGGFDKKTYFLDKETGNIIKDKKVSGEIYRNAVQDDKNLYFVSDNDGLYSISKLSKSLNWKMSINTPSWSEIIFVKDTIYLASNNYLYKVNKLNGEIIWKKTLANWIETTPITIGNNLILGALNGRVYCLNSINSKLKWITKTNGSISAKPIMISKNIVLIASLDQHLYFLDLQSGQIINKLNLKMKLYASPLVIDNTIYVIGLNGYLMRIKYEIH